MSPKRPTEDELLILRVDYSVPYIWCKSPHPSEPVYTCALEVGHEAGGYHATRDGANLVKWKDDASSPVSGPSIEVSTVVSTVTFRDRQRPSEN